LLIQSSKWIIFGNTFILPVHLNGVGSLKLHLHTNDLGFDSFTKVILLDFANYLIQRYI
jgi:hypothetical protein